MTQMRQVADPEAALAIRSLALGLPAAFRIGRHSHPWSQLIFATRGVMTVTTADGAWVAPPQRAVWVPSDVEHEIETTGQVTMRTLYLRPDVALELPAGCFVVNVSPLLRELVLHVKAYDNDISGKGKGRSVALYKVQL